MSQDFMAPDGFQGASPGVIVPSLECGGLTPLFCRRMPGKRRQAAALQSKVDATRFEGKKLLQQPKMTQIAQIKSKT